MNLFGEKLAQLLEGVVSLEPRQLEFLEQHWRLLSHWNKKINLTSITQTEEAVRRHYAESLFLAANLPQVRLVVADLGSGAGFPGIPMAVARPECEVHLVESDRRKAVFLREACRSLPNVRVRTERAEDLKGSFDWLVSRAVSPALVLECARRLGVGAGLLLSRKDADTVLGEKGLPDCRIIELPWDKKSCVLLVPGVPRGTS